MCQELWRTTQPQGTVLSPFLVYSIHFWPQLQLTTCRSSPVTHWGACQWTTAGGIQRPDGWLWWCRVKHLKLDKRELIVDFCRTKSPPDPHIPFSGRMFQWFPPINTLEYVWATLQEGSDLTLIPAEAQWLQHLQLFNSLLLYGHQGTGRLLRSYWTR